MPDPSLFTSIINSYLPEPHAALLNGILFGVPIKSIGFFYDELKIVGLLHLVVLSGINITLLATMIAVITKPLGRYMSSLISIICIVIFVLFVRPQAPIIRAAFMGIITLVAVAYGRKTIALYILVLSAVFTAIIWPEWLTTVSFQLSYAATLGIILFNRPSKVLVEQSSLQKLKSFIWLDVKTSLSAQVFTVPMIFWYFKQVSLIAPVANLLVSFMILPVMVFGFLTGVLGKIHYELGLVPAYISYGMLSYMVFIIDTLSRLPFVYFKF